MGVLSNKVPRETLKPGDHIYSWRHGYVYSHHGIYADEGQVIHFTRGGGQEIGTGTVLDRFIFSSSPPSKPSGEPCPQCGDQSNADGVIKSCLDCFLAGGDLYLFEYNVSPVFFLAKARGGTCTLAKPDPPDDILYRASHLLENGFGNYNIFKNNCEDFAIYCKTGLLVVTNLSVGRSGQATAFLAAVSAVVSSPLRYLTTSFSGLAAVGFGMYCVSRLASDIGVRRDVVKVPVERLVTGAGLAEPERLVAGAGLAEPERLVTGAGLAEPERLVTGAGLAEPERLVTGAGLAEPAKLVTGAGLAEPERLVTGAGLAEPERLVTGAGLAEPKRLVTGAGLAEPERLVTGAGLAEPERLVTGAGLAEPERLVTGAGLDEPERLVTGAGLDEKLIKKEE